MKLTYEKILETILTEEKIELYLEAITPEQKEKSQREMAKDILDPFKKLKEYLNNKWKNKKTKEDYEKSKKEFIAYNFLLKIFDDPQGDKESTDYIKKITGKNPPLVTVKGNFNGILTGNDCLPYMVINTNNEDEKYINGLKLKTNKIKEISKQFIINHEYGHFYEFLKDFIENGSAEIIDTYTAEPNKIIDSEGKANAYALDNMYRKDRRELLKNSEEDDNVYSKKYIEGTKKYSKTYTKTKESIEKENKHFNY